MARGLVIVVSLALSACSATGGPFGSRSSAATSTAADTGTAAGPSDAINAEGLAVYLDMMRLLIEGDSLTQAEIMSDVAESADIAPTTTNRLKHALALSVPGHPGSDAGLAEQRLSALLSASDALLPEERVLATIQLRDVEQRLVLETAAARLRAEMTAAIEQQNAATAQRVQRLLDENQRLQTELDDATSKLEAVTSIEQSIRERENGAN